MHQLSLDGGREYSEQSGNRFFDEFINAVETLADMPMRCPLAQENLRWILSCDNFILGPEHNELCLLPIRKPKPSTYCSFEGTVRTTYQIPTSINGGVALNRSANIGADLDLVRESNGGEARVVQYPG